MKRWVSMSVLTLWMALGHLGAQEARELTREEKKALQERTDSLQHADAEAAIEKKAFTLEADQVVFKYGETAVVSSTTNFVSVDGDEAVVQLAFDIPSAGLNGLGGVTVDGRISRYECRKDKRGSLLVSMDVMGVGISARVEITLMGGSNRASVVVSPNFNSNRITLNGVVLPKEHSRVFKGSSF